jgi:hypothetical protein
MGLRSAADDLRLRAGDSAGALARAINATSTRHATNAPSFSPPFPWDDAALRGGDRLSLPAADRCRINHALGAGIAPSASLSPDGPRPVFERLRAGREHAGKPSPAPP